MEKYRLTTNDNPFNPFTQWDQWFFYDSMVRGYCTCERLSRKAKTSDQLPDETNDIEIEAAMDELIEVGAISKQGDVVDYVKVKNPDYKEEEDISNEET